MAYVFGTNFDSLNNAAQGYNNLNLRVAENAQNAYQRDQEKQTQDAIFAQRQQEEDARLNQQQQYQFYQAAQQAARDKQAQATDAYRFNVGESDKAAERQQQQYQFGANMDLSRQQMTTQQAQQKTASLFSEAVNLVKSGKYDDDPDGVVRDHPGLAPQQYSYLNSLWDAKNKKALTAYATKQAEAEAATQNVQTPGWLPKNRFQMAAKGLQPVVDSTSTNIVPLMPPPYQRPSTNAPDAGTTPPPNISFVPPAAPPQFMFGQSEGALPQQSPVVAPQSFDVAPSAPTPDRTAVGGYKLGMTYKQKDGSKLVYLGGDPNDEGSWQPAQ